MQAKGSVIKTYDYMLHLLTERANALLRGYAERRSCSTCCSWMPSPEEANLQGECRLCPPQMTPQMLPEYVDGKPTGNYSSHIHTMLPKTPAAFWCAEWRRFPGLWRLMGRGRI